MRRLTLAGVVAALALSGCGNPIPPGTVIEKEHEPRKVTSTTSCSGTGTKRTCTPKTTTRAECWELEIRDDQGNEHETCVSEREWDKWSVGSRYPGSK